MVESLIYHLPGHSGAILGKRWIGPDTVDYGNFDAGDNPLTVAFRIHQRILRVMGDTEEIPAQAHVPKMHLVGQGISQIPIILMPVGPDEFEMPAVEKETLVRIEAEAPYAEGIHLHIDKPALPVQKPGKHGIELGRINIPQCRMADSGIGGYAQAGVGPCLGDALPHHRRLRAVGSDQRVLEYQARSRGEDAQTGFYMHGRGLRRYFRSRDIDTLEMVLGYE